MNKIFIGVDPGKKGALAVITIGSLTNTTTVRVVPFDEAEYKRALNLVSLTLADGDSSAYCFVERVGAMPGQGVTSMFHFGENFGFIQGLLMAYDIPFLTVPPQKWKKEFSLGKNKEDSIYTARKLFPKISLRPTEKSKKDNDGMAEALLIAEYCRRKM